MGHLGDGPIVFPLSKTGIKHAKNWNTQLMMTKLPNGKRAPFFSSVWKLSTVLNKNEQGSWYQVGERKTAITRTRFITLKEFNDYVLPLKESVQQLTTQVDYSQITDETNTKEEGETKDNPF